MYDYFAEVMIQRRLRQFARAQQRRREIAALHRMVTPPPKPDRNRCAYVPPKGSIALSFFYRF